MYPDGTLFPLDLLMMCPRMLFKLIYAELQRSSCDMETLHLCLKGNLLKKMFYCSIYFSVYIVYCKLTKM